MRATPSDPAMENDAESLCGRVCERQRSGERERENERERVGGKERRLFSLKKKKLSLSCWWLFELADND